LGGLNTYDISFNMTQLFSAKIHAGERTEHSKMRYFFRKMLFFEIFWTFKFDQKFEPKSRNCGDSNDSQYKDKFQNSRISAPKQSQPKVFVHLYPLKLKDYE